MSILSSTVTGNNAPVTLKMCLELGWRFTDQLNHVSNSPTSGKDFKYPFELIDGNPYWLRYKSTKYVNASIRLVYKNELEYKNVPNHSVSVVLQEPVSFFAEFGDDIEDRKLRTIADLKEFIQIIELGEEYTERIWKFRKDFGEI